jgi:hypothetical protein
MGTPEQANKKAMFPIFRSRAEAEAYSEQTGDAYYEFCYELEGRLNVSRQAIHELYAKATTTKRPRMQTGVVREFVCPEGWPKYPKTLICTLVSWSRYQHEDTVDGYLIREAMAALVVEKDFEGTRQNAAYDRRTFEPCSDTDAENARQDLLRLCDWIESRLHFLTHSTWYGCPECFSDDPEKTHLANIGVAQRHLANLSGRDQKIWEGIHARAAAKHQSDLKKWGTVGKVQHDPQPRTWTHPDVDARIINLWPLVTRFNWTYSDLLKVLDKLLPAPAGGGDRRYPLDSTESLKVHCRTICGLTKTGKGKSAKALPRGWEIAQKFFRSTGK